MKTPKKSSLAVSEDKPMPPTIRLTGNHAKKFHGIKPGGKVLAHIKGTVMNTGFDEYSGEPVATVRVGGVSTGQGKPGLPAKRGK